MNIKLNHFPFKSIIHLFYLNIYVKFILFWYVNYYFNNFIKFEKNVYFVNNSKCTFY